MGWRTGAGKRNWRQSGSVESVRLKPFPTATKNIRFALSAERGRRRFDEARGAFVERIYSINGGGLTELSWGKGEGCRHGVNP
jgi:hypothetical protein